MQTDASPDRLPLGLDEKPHIVSVGLNVHGRRAEEEFVMDGTWSLHLYRWRGSVTFSGREYAISPGTVSLTPPYRRLRWKFPPKPCVHYYAHFRVPTVSGQAKSGIPIVQKPGSKFEALWREMEWITGRHGSHPLRAEVRLWDVLLGLADAGEARSAPDRRLPPVLNTAVIIIDNEIRETLRVGVLARRVGISRNQLIHLFNRHLNIHPQAYIHARRLSRATELLRSESIPIQAVAEECGMQSLQQFNKFIRHKTGLPPRAYRRVLTES
ncbi:MAG: AraC family transcriptional regulator [Verrucomicrobiae bacterium]|nr:AraC family transcriptional regulator [Verrucomicrobiae bacterium]